MSGAARRELCRSVTWLMLFPGPAMAQAKPALTLTEAWSVRWPERSRISRVVPGVQMRIAIQSGSWIYMLKDALPPVPIGNFEILDVVGLAASEAGLELVDRRTHRIVRTDTAGRVTSWTPVPTASDNEIASGASTPCGWAIGLRANGGTGNRLLFLDWAEPKNHPLELPFAPRRLTATGKLLAISEDTAPYRVALVNCDSTQVITIDTSEVQADLDMQTWRPLPAFVVNTQVLQTWVDAGSDRRRFASYGLDGTVLRWVDLSAPLTLVAAFPSGFVIGLRGIGDLEVVGFTLSAQGR